ncbi:MAG: arginine--tRNA ligase, partial [Candidatus Lokiarchaeota archaeon]
LNDILKYQDDFGKIEEGRLKKLVNPKKYVIEFPSPNTNKPLHLGHIRNILLGQSLSNLLEYKGHKSFKVNLNNDRGIHICKSMLAYKKWGNGQEPNKKPDHFVGDFYVKYNEMLEKDKDLEEEAQELLKKWEEGDPNIRKLWKKMNKWAFKGFNETFDYFDVKFNKQYYESEIYKVGKEKIREGVNKGLFEVLEDGAVIAKLENKYNLPDKILLRNDGTSVYVTQDIFLAYKKKEDFNFDKSIYVVGNEQDMYFNQLFAVLDLLGFEGENYHLSYGMIYLPSGKMKSREGTVVDADDLVEEVIHLAYDEVDKRYPNLSEEEKRERSITIGMAAIRFYILKYNPRKDFTFFPDKSISFEGETGPYIQYVYSRIESIIRKSQLEIDEDDFDASLLNSDIEYKLFSQLNYFPEIINEAIKNYDTHIIADYLLGLGQTFNSFYTLCPVISEKKELEKARLVLIKCVQTIIKIGLNVLGIKVLENM